MRAALLVIALTAPACIEAQLVMCEDGRACAQGLVCDDLHQTCITSDQLAACVGLADAAPCTAGALQGICYDGVCLAVGCGNSVVEPGEVCDDGNRTPGDGCSYDCSSSEECGNRIVDGARGEACDDGNKLSHDGCDSLCGIETLAVRPVSLEGWVFSKLVVYDAGRRRVVLAIPAIGTFELDVDNQVWSPSAALLDINADLRLGVYDPGRQRVVLIGTSEVAEWDGTSWTMRPISGTPPSTLDVAIYDPNRQAILVFGSTSSAYLDMTAGTWQGNFTPPFSTYAAAYNAAYDEQRQRIVVASPQEGIIPAKTWEFDGTTWTSVQAIPSGYGQWAMTYDAAHQRVVSYGGRLNSGYENKVYAWNGSTWTATGAQLPRGSMNAALWYDATTQSLFVGDGQMGLNRDRDQIWQITNTTVVERTPLVPPIDTLVAGVYVPARDQLVHVDRNGATWGWDGSWQPIAAAPGPSPSVPGVYDPVRGGIVVDDAGTTWLFTDDWQQLPVTDTGAETPRATAYDHANHRVVAASSTSQSTLELSSTGAAWQRAVSVLDPTVVLGLAYDRASAGIVAFTSGGGLADLEGDRWTETLGPGTGYVVSTWLARGSIIMIPDYMASSVIWERRGADWRELGSMGADLFVGSIAESKFGRLSVRTLSYNVGAAVLEYQWRSTLPDESCVAGEDTDGDGAAYCADPDCWWKCHPACPYEASCP